MSSRLARWRDGLGQLRHPGPPPPGALPLAAAMLALTFLVIAVLIWLGVTRYDRAARYFGEGRARHVLLRPAARRLRRRGRRAGAPGRATSGTALLVGGRGAFLYLSLDEVYGLHEELDRGVHKLLGWHDRRHWLTDHLDDVFVALYGVIALAWADRHFERLVRLRWTALMFGVAFLCFVGMTVLDFTGLTAWLEDSLKLLAGTLILAGLAHGLPRPGLGVAGALTALSRAGGPARARRRPPRNRHAGPSRRPARRPTPAGARRRSRR